MRSTLSKSLLLAALVTVVLAACGGGDSGAEGRLEDAAEHLTDAESGHLTFSLTGEREGEEVGFEVDAEFEHPRADAYPKLDVSYARLRGAESSENVLRSDGTSAWIVNGGAVTGVPLNRLEGVRNREGVAASVPDLDLATWIDEAEADGDVVTGKVDIEQLVANLARVAAEIDGNRFEGSFTDEEVDELRDALEDSSIEARLEDGELRELTATFDFGGKIPAALDRGLVTYAASAMELRITFEPLDGELTIEVPGS